MTGALVSPGITLGRFMEGIDYFPFIFPPCRLTTEWTTLKTHQNQFCTVNVVLRSCCLPSCMKKPQIATRVNQSPKIACRYNCWIYRKIITQNRLILCNQNFRLESLFDRYCFTHSLCVGVMLGKSRECKEFLSCPVLFCPLLLIFGAFNFTVTAACF